MTHFLYTNKIIKIHTFQESKGYELLNVPFFIDPYVLNSESVSQRIKPMLSVSYAP